jgi:hypothetical protein
VLEGYGNGTYVPANEYEISQQVKVLLEIVGNLADVCYD